jgi:hypothetical protein
MATNLSGNVDDILGSLTGYELLAGILANSKRVERFEVKALYTFLAGLKERYPRALRYMSFRRMGDRVMSPEVDQYLRFFRFGKILRLSAMPNPVVQLYQVPQAARDSLGRDIEDRKLSDRQKEVLTQLSAQFEATVTHPQTTS